MINTAVTTAGTASVGVAGGHDDPLLGTHHLLRNAGTVTCYIGDNTVTAATGFPLKADEVVGVDLAPDEVIYAVTSASTTSIAAFSTGEAA